MPSGGAPAELDGQSSFSAPELNAGSHRLDGVLWRVGSETGSPELPVVVLEVQGAPTLASSTAWPPSRSLLPTSSMPALSTGGWW